MLSSSHEDASGRKERTIEGTQKTYNVYLQLTVSLVMSAGPILAAILVLAAIVDVLIQFLNRSAIF